MTDARTFKLSGYEQTALPFLARVYKLVPGVGKSPIVRADIASIAVTVRRFPLTSGAWGQIATTLNAAAVTVSSAVFDSLQTDSAWTADALGYNFAHTIPASAFPGLGEYSAVYIFTPASGTISIFPLIIKPLTIVSLQGILPEG